MIISVCGKPVIIDDDFDLSVLTNNLTIISSGYAASRLENKKILLHHLILPKKSGFLVDHVNGNKLDNRRENLRYLTRSDNTFNAKKLWGHNTSGFRGISRLTDRKSPGWRSFVQYRGKTYYSRFDCPFMAVKWVKDFYREHNIPQEAFIGGNA